MARSWSFATEKEASEAGDAGDEGSEAEGDATTEVESEGVATCRA